MSRAVSAFAPGHVSGLFAVHDEAREALERGSRGAGWCLELGARARVQPGHGAVLLKMGGLPADLPVTRRALHHLAPGASLEVEVRLDLPVGQGFGMSAAGSLAACLAAARLLDLEPERALEAAHRAEVESGTGLGDAVAAWHGSAEVRIAPGAPPHGQVLRVEPPAKTEFLYLVMGKPIPTRTIIRDDAWKAATRRLGDEAVDRIVAAGKAASWTSILEESGRFSRGFGLMPEGMEALAAELPSGLAWGQCMLGSTLWVTGPAEALDAAHKVLDAVGGSLVRCGVDRHGARILRTP